MPRSRSGRTTSLRESESRLSESERIEGAGSWDAIEWTKVDVCEFQAGVFKFLTRCAFNFFFFFSAAGFKVCSPGIAAVLA